MRNVALAFILALSVPSAAFAANAAYPSCDLEAQRALQAEAGGETTDPLQAHIAARSDVLEADISAAHTAEEITQDEADRLMQRIGTVRDEVAGFVSEQGFLSGAELASYDRNLDAIAATICG